MQLILRAVGFLGILVSVIWWFAEPGYDPLYAFITGIAALLASYLVPKSERQTESLDQHNRRIMLNHVENFWVKGVLEESLHGAALLEFGIKEEPTAVSYPWTLRKESTNETLSSDTSMLDIFEAVGMGRSLLILGAPGSGKTTMLLELARQLIERARQDRIEPIPVVFNLASWKERQELTDWLVEQLNLVYYVPRKTASTWVDENQMMLLLDGLDEVQSSRRESCVQSINQFRQEHGLTSIVVTSRMEEYLANDVRLSLEGALTLQPLTSKQVAAYFDHFGKNIAGIKQLLKKDKALQELAKNPLILSIIVLAYRDRKLDNPLPLRTLERQRKHLFDAYIDRMFEHSNRSVNVPFSQSETLHYLSWLARTMILHNINGCQVETMQPAWFLDKCQRRSYELCIGLGFGLSSGLIVGTLFGLLSKLVFVTLPFGPTAALIGGSILGWFSVKKEKIVMVDRLRWSWKGFWLGLLIWPLIGANAVLITGLIVVVYGNPSEALTVLTDWATSGLCFGVIFTLLAAWYTGFYPAQIEEANYPGQRLKQTLYNGLFTAVVAGLLFGSSFGLFIGWAFEPIRGLLSGLVLLLLGGLIFGLVAILPILQHYSLRWVMAKYKLLPLQLIPFLDYCVSLIFLRRVGGGYIFVHRLLMEHFAKMDVERTVS